MYRLLSIALVLAAGAPAAASSPIAEVICAPREQMVARLKQQFGEQRQGAGLRDPETMMEVWSSPDRGTWTLVMAYADGRSCIVAMGEDWADLAPPDPA